MATIRIMQIPTQTGSYTGTNTFEECLPSNYWAISPITVRIDEDLSSYFKVKYILRIYKNSVSASNLLSTLKQRTNNNSSTTNQIAIFDIRGIVNTQLQFTNRDSNATTYEVHTIGKNVTSKLFSKNNGTIKTIVVVATWEFSTSASNPPVEQTGDTTTMTMYFSPATFRLFQVVNEDINPLNKYFINSATLSFALSNLHKEQDIRERNRFLTVSILQGAINYVSARYCYHTIAFLNKSSWGSDGQYIALIYYDKTGTQTGSTYTIQNNTTQGGTLPASAASDDAYMIFAGVGTKNLTHYQGACFKDNVALANFDGQPNNITDWAYYSIQLVNDQSGSGGKSNLYYFVKDNTLSEHTDILGNTYIVNCQQQPVIRLGWINQLGAWDYYNFRGGFVETLKSERMDYTSIIGASELNDGDVYTFDTWSRGKSVLKTNTTATARIESQFMSEQQAKLLEPLFSSPSVMIIDNNLITTTFEGASQPVVVTNKSFERKTKSKNRIEIKYTFEIEYASKLNTIE
jgi:hypothetical protein